MLLLCGWEDQNDIWMRRAERWDEKNYFMWMLCLWSKMLPFTRISPGFHLGLPCFGEETMLFWIMFICLYIYSNLLIICFQILTKMLLIVKRSKYIEVRSYFKVFVEANTAVQSDLNFFSRIRAQHIIVLRRKKLHI